MIDRLLLPLLLAGCALLAVIVVAEIEPAPAPSPLAASAPRVSDAPTPPIRREPRGRYEALLETSLARPLFSATRRPAARGGTDDSADSGLADTRLTGIVTEPGRRIAIFAPEGAKAVTVSEGETVGGWRIESITPREVSLTGPDGTKTLQPKFDPNLVPASGPPSVVNRPAVPGASPFPVGVRPVRPGMPPIFNRAPPRPGQQRGRR